MSIVDIKQDLSPISPDFYHGSGCVAQFPLIHSGIFCPLGQTRPVILILAAPLEPPPIWVCGEELEDAADSAIEPGALIDHKSSGLHAQIRVFFLREGRPLLLEEGQEFIGTIELSTGKNKIEAQAVGRGGGDGCVGVQRLKI